MPTETDDAFPAEDLVGNLRDVAEIAGRLCDGCADHHILYTARRLIDAETGIGVDGSEMTAIVGRLLADRRTRGLTTPANIMIAGTADTGLLATAATAAATLGPGWRRLVRFTVVDRCGTPLEFCRRYATRYDLDLDLRRADLLEAPAIPPADVVMVHSLLRFIPHDLHVRLLQGLAGRLAPGGRIVFSQSLRKPRERKGVFTEDRLDELAAIMADELTEPAETFRRRLFDLATGRRKSREEFAGARDVLDLFARAGLTVESADELAGTRSSRRRLLAVLAPAASETQ